VPAGPADHYGQFGLVVHLPGYDRVDDVLIRADHRGRGFYKEQRLLGQGVADLGGVVPVVQPQGHDLRRLAGGQERDLRQGHDLPGGIFQAVIRRGPQDRDFLAFQDAVTGPALHFKTDDAHLF
jgi:hypothetical protein